MKELNLGISHIIKRDGTLDISMLKTVLTKIETRINNNILSNFYGNKKTVTTISAVTNLHISHGLNIIPNYVTIVKRTPDTASVTFDYNNFTTNDIIITTDSAVIFDIVIGRLDE